jgi:gluconolactonase
MSDDDSGHGLTSLPALEAGVLSGEASVSLAVTASFLEGPACDVDGTVYFSDIAANRIMRLEANGRLTVYREDSGRANGNVFDLEGRLVTCEGAEMGDGGRRRVTRTDLTNGRVEILTERFEGKRYNSPNDVVVDRRGRMYFTDPRYGDRSDLELDVEAVYLIDVDGSVRRIISQPTIERPNGLAVTPDASVLYVIDSNPQPGGNRKIWAFPLDDTGTPGPSRLVHDFAPGRGGDGMELDQDGNLYVCAGLGMRRGTGETTDVPPGVYVFEPDGGLLGSIPVPHDTITNCCFGGPDLRTLYVTVGPSLYHARVARPGYHAYPVTV